MNGWPSTPWPKEHHDRMLELVRADNGGTLPDWALSVDLVYLADRANHPSGRWLFPGRRELERRWGLGERQVRAALRSREWQMVCERFGIELPERRMRGVPVGVPQASPSPSPSPSPSDTSEPPQSVDIAPVAVPVPVPQASPSPSTRAVSTSPTSPPLPVSGENTETPPPAAAPSSDGFDDLLRVWNERVVPAAKVAAHPRLNRTRGIGQKLAARLREHGRDQVALVLRWYAQSPDDRARFLRDGRYELGTLMRPEKFDGYLAFALDWKRRGSPLATGPPAGELLGLNRHTWRETRSDGERAEAERRAQEALPELQELLAKRTKEAG